MFDSLRYKMEWWSTLQGDDLMDQLREILGEFHDVIWLPVYFFVVIRVSDDECVSYTFVWFAY